MLQKYEVLILTVPEITGDELKNLEGQLEKVIRAEGGSIISFDRWGKYKLAYPIKKNDYGVYTLVRFEVPKNIKVTHEIKMLFKVRFTNVVIRELITALHVQQPLVYQRPRSLEEAPARDVEDFLKENKMSGLLSSVEATDHEEEE